MAQNRSERTKRASSARRQRERQAVRQHILNVAAGLFETRGPEDFSLREVAEHAGYSPTTIYRYFKDKDDLLYTVTDEGHAAFMQQLREASVSATNPLTRLYAVGRAYVAFGIANPGYYRLLFIHRPDFLTEPPPRPNQPPRVRLLGVLRDVVRDAIESGRLRQAPLETTVQVLWSALHGVVSLHLAMPFVEAEHVSAAVLDATITGLQASGLPKAPSL